MSRSQMWVQKFVEVKKCCQIESKMFQVKSVLKSGPKIQGRKMSQFWFQNIWDENGLRIGSKISGQKMAEIFMFGNISVNGTSTKSKYFPKGGVQNFKSKNVRISASRFQRWKMVAELVLEVSMQKMAEISVWNILLNETSTKSKHFSKMRNSRPKITEGAKRVKRFVMRYMWYMSVKLVSVWR